jgi:hypothetical protein
LLRLSKPEGFGSSSEIARVGTEPIGRGTLPNAMAEQLLKVAPGAPNVFGEAGAGRLELLPLSVEQYDR